VRALPEAIDRLVTATAIPNGGGDGACKQAVSGPDARCFSSGPSKKNGLWEGQASDLKMLVGIWPRVRSVL
jgi:hypothetical protein